MLPYDPVRDEVILIEQFRVGALEAPGGPWLLEIVAGVIDEGESAPPTWRGAESLEEAGREILALEPICDYLSSPGGCSGASLAVLRPGRHSGRRRHLRARR